MINKTYINNIDITPLKDIKNYGALSYEYTIKCLDEIQKVIDLKGKKLLDFGAGDARVSLIATNEYGMEAVAVELNPIISDFAEQILNDAGKYSQNIELIKNTDALEVDWKNVDVVFFYYIEPGQDEGEEIPGKTNESFRKSIEDKIKQSGSILACVFNPSHVYDKGNLITDKDVYCKRLNLTPLSPAIQLGDDIGSEYLQLYQNMV